MTSVLSLQRMAVRSMDPCIWSGYSCDSGNSCVSAVSSPK